MHYSRISPNFAHPPFFFVGRSHVSPSSDVAIPVNFPPQFSKQLGGRAYPNKRKNNEEYFLSPYPIPPPPSPFGITPLATQPTSQSYGHGVTQSIPTPPPTMVKVSEALFERIRERVEYLIHKRVGEGVRLSGEEKAVIRDELKTLIAGAHSISNKDLARVASRVATWKAQSNARSGGGGGGGGGGGATSSILPPVKCSTPQTEVRSQVLARRSTIDTPSSVTQVSSRQPQPPRQVPKGKNKWASGIKEDVERYQQEQAVLTTTLRNNISKHRADLERQVNEKKAAALNEREEEKRYLQTQATCNEEREKEFLQQQDNKRRVWERARAERVKDYHTRLDEKERLVQMARKEDEAVAEELNRIVASEKEKKKEYVCLTFRVLRLISQKTHGKAAEGARAQPIPEGS